MGNLTAQQKNTILAFTKNSSNPRDRLLAGKVARGQLLPRSVRDRIRDLIKDPKTSPALKTALQRLLNANRLASLRTFNAALANQGLQGSDLARPDDARLQGLAGVDPLGFALVIPDNPGETGGGFLVDALATDSLGTGNVQVASRAVTEAESTWQTARYLRLANGTQERVTVRLLYRSATARGWVWVPVRPREGGKPLAYDLEPGKVLDVEHDGLVLTSKIRLWAQSAERQWQRFRDQDLWLVEADADGNRGYYAPQPETKVFAIR
jgi:hypothetical protein